MISLDVGGTHKIRTSLDILCKVQGSTLQKMFVNHKNLKRNQDGYIFLDRDGKTFLTLVNYLRNERRSFPVFETKHEQDLFVQELRFWRLSEDIKPGFKSIK